VISRPDQAVKARRLGPGLARALLRTQTGRAVRSDYREERIEAIRRAVTAEAPCATGPELERAAAVLAYLCSSNHGR
jgi:hypothetical protein